MAAENHLLGLLDFCDAIPLETSHEDDHGRAWRGTSWLVIRDRIRHFPQSTIISVLARTEQGQTAETSIVGREGMIGSSSIHGIMT